MNNINQRILYLSGLVAGAIIKNEHWKVFGFKERPKRGKFFEKFVDQSKLAKEKFLIKELFLLSAIDVIETIKNKDIAEQDKLLYMIGILSQLFLPLAQSNIFNNESDLFNFLKNGIEVYSNQEFVDCLISRAKKSVDEKDVKSLLGGCVIIAASSKQGKGFILDREIINREIYSVGPEEKLNFSFDKSKLEAYSEFAQEIIKY